MRCMFAEHQAMEHFRSLLNFVLTLKKNSKVFGNAVTCTLYLPLNGQLHKTGTSLKRTPGFGP